jgi:hypothetical protein
MPAVAAVEAYLLDMVQVGLPANGATNNNPTTTTNRITEVLRRHRTALPRRTTSIRETHSIGMTDIMDSKAVLSFNPQRIPILVCVVATKSMRHHRAHQPTNMEMESSDNPVGTDGTKESQDQIENCTLSTDFPLAFSI